MRYILYAIFSVSGSVSSVNQGKYRLTSEILLSIIYLFVNEAIKQHFLHTYMLFWELLRHRNLQNAAYILTNISELGWGWVALMLMLCLVSSFAFLVFRTTILLISDIVKLI